MAEGAALLVDHVLPAIDYRQWVLSFEGPLAVRLGYDRALLAKVAERLARAVMQDKRLTSTQIWSSPVVLTGIQSRRRTDLAEGPCRTAQSWSADQQLCRLAA